MKNFIFSTLTIFGPLLLPAGAVWGEGTKVNDTFLSGGVSVRMTRFEPDGKGKHPALLLVHGLHSPEESAPLLESVANRYVRQGYAVALVHYFDRTGTGKQEIEALIVRFQAFLSGKGDAETDRLFESWLETLRDGLAHLRGRPGVAPDRVGVVGISLGGYLATALAAQKELSLAAVVELFGGMPGSLRPHAGKLPPVLIVHGDRDEVVPVSEAHALKEALQAQKVTHEVLILKGVGHVFATEKGGFRWDAALAADRTIRAFLEKHLPVGAKSTPAPALGSVVMSSPTWLPIR